MSSLDLDHIKINGAGFTRRRRAPGHGPQISRVNVLAGERASRRADPVLWFAAP
jgi:hypothetical protein